MRRSCTLVALLISSLVAIFVGDAAVPVILCSFCELLINQVISQSANLSRPRWSKAQQNIESVTRLVLSWRLAAPYHSWQKSCEEKVRTKSSSQADTKYSNIRR